MPAKRVHQLSSPSNNLSAPQQHHQQHQHQHYQQPSLSHSSSNSQLGVKPSPSLPTFTRSASPSGISNFFSKPTKWFSRSSSGSRPSPTEPRASTSSSTSSRRRPTISGPTDPRPIESIPSPGPESKFSGSGALSGLNDRASRSVLDLSSRTSTDLNNASPTGSNGSGDLRSISRKGWSRSVDNLSIVPPRRLDPLNTSLEAKIEQYRTGTPSTPSSISQKIFPFPSMPGTPSTPPGEHPIHQLQLRHGGAHSLSGSQVSVPMSSAISVSTSATATTAGASPGGGGGRLAPPSPVRTTRKRSFDFDRTKSGNKSVDSLSNHSGSGSGSRSGGFPFYFGGSGGSGGNPERKNSTPTQYTPTIIEPTHTIPEEDCSSSKRASQIVTRSGFINRLQNYQLSAPQLASSKNWKPYKMVLKGSKVYFYKPPSDRTAAVKELFPVGLVTATEQDEEEDDQDADASNGKEKEELRKKRAFWGRRTHPDLTIKDRKVEKGSLEALIHEVIFGTTFDSHSLETKSPDAWQEFASGILLCLPLLVDSTRFEYEFERCASYLLSGAEEGTKSSLSKRVVWLVERYLAYHVHPADTESWKTFCRDIIPDFDLSKTIETFDLATKNTHEEVPETPVIATPIAERPLNMSNSLLLQTPPPGRFFSSPSHSASPSPLPSPASPSPSHAHSIKSSMSSRGRLWAALEQGGLTREIFVKLEPEHVAQSLIIYQRSILEAVFNSKGDDKHHFLSADVLFSENPESPLSSFFGCDDAPHWLTRLVVMQILGPGHTRSFADYLGLGPQYGGSDRSSGLTSFSMPSEHPQNSRTHVRSDVINRWARVAELCRLAGDECSWKAIMTALTSKPIARLEKAWKRVDSTAINAVRTWIYAFTSLASVNKKDSFGVSEPRRSPWGGDGRFRVAKIVEKLLEEKKNGWKCKSMIEAMRIFQEFFVSLQGCVAALSAASEGSISEVEDVAKLSEHWKELAKKPAPNKMNTIHQFMSLSFAAEPRRKGLFAPYYWTRQSQSNMGPQVLIPLLVPELLPTVTLIDRSQLVRTKKVSYESIAVLNSDAQSITSQLKFDSDGQIRSPESQRQQQMNDMRGGLFDLGGMVLPVFDGELLLCVVSSSEVASKPLGKIDENQQRISEESSGTGSNPPSRTPSIRVKSAAAGLDRKSSRDRRASLPALSQQRSPPAIMVIEPHGEPTLYAVVQAGTLEALVHFLVHGLEGVSVSVADDNGEMSLREKKSRAVKVERREFAKIWWSSFRSFVSPYDFFKHLRKEYLMTSSPRKSISAEDLVNATRTRLCVIRVISEWLHHGNGAQDVLDNIELYKALQAFLTIQNDHDLTSATILTDDSDEAKELMEILRQCESERTQLLHTFISQTMRPQIRHVPVRGSSTTSTVHSFGKEPPRFDDISPLELVNNLDAMASAAFRSVNQEDLYVTADLLEVQTSDRTGWFIPREPFSSSEEVEIQSFYTFLMEIEPTSLIGEYSEETIYRLLPPGVRGLVRAYSILRKWVICCLTTPQIGCMARQEKMEKVLQAIEICRLRSIEGVGPNTSPAERPCVRSFVESVLTSAVVSPESRIFGRAWQAVGNVRGVQADSLASLLSVRIFDQNEILGMGNEKLTVDPAWLLERMLEVISLSDVLDSPMEMETPTSLVNFDKRRQLCNVVVNASSYASRGSRQRREMDRTDFERMNKMEQKVNETFLDLRLLKDDALREAANFGPPSTPSRKGGNKPFQRLIALQQEKNKRDKFMRDRLMKEKRHEQHKLERKEEDLSRSMDGRGQQQLGPGGPSAKHQRSKRSMSALFNLMRPISTAFTSESGLVASGHHHSNSSNNIGLRRTAAELDFTPTNKPALVLSLVDAKVMAFINNERSFTFQIDTEDGGHYLLQAMTKSDMGNWVQAISGVVKSYAQRRLTYLGGGQGVFVDPTSGPGAGSASGSSGARDPRAVFGVDLTFLVKREAGTEEVSPDAVPRVLELCLAEIEKRGLTEQGIYRVAGATSEVNALKEALNNGQNFIDQYTDINAVCGVVKFWFRTLPETVIPELFFESIVEAARIPDLDERLSKIREVIYLFPRAHFTVLRRLIEHLDRVIDYEDQNHMTPDNLATVLSPNLFRAPNNNFGLIMKNMGPITVLFKALITHMHFIFDEGVEEDEEEVGLEGDATVEGEQQGEVRDEGEGEEEEEFFDATIDPGTPILVVPEIDLGPRFTASPESEKKVLEDDPLNIAF